MKKVLILLGVIVLAGCAEIESDKPVSCSLTSADFTYENVGVHKYQIKLKDPNKPRDTSLFWSLVDVKLYSEIEPLIEYKAENRDIPQFSKEVILYVNKNPNSHINALDLAKDAIQCGEPIQLKPLSTSPTCDQVKVSTSVDTYNSLENSYKLKVELNTQLDMYYDKVSLKFANNFIAQGAQTLENTKIYSIGLSRDAVKDVLYRTCDNYNNVCNVYLLATFNIDYQNGTTCVKDIVFNITNLHPELTKP